MTSTIDFKKYKKVATALGATTVIGCCFWEYFRIKRLLNSLVNTNVLDIHKKRPDYIYIKYHIYRESMRKMQIKQEHDKNWVNIIIHPVGKWWKTIKHSVAWRLLEVAKNGNHHDKFKAVQQLSRIDHLKDWDYQHLAQICDARTAISLARHSCDSRWFLPPVAANAYRQPLSLVYDFHTLLDSITPSECTKYFTKKVFNKFSFLKGYEYDDGYYAKRQPKGQDTLRQCIEALTHLTKNPQNAREIIEAGGLVTVMEMYKIFSEHLEIRFLLSKIIANLSVCSDKAEDFFVTGWVGVLAKWTTHMDMRIRVVASKSLCNLDLDDYFQCLYPYRVYPLYPRHRTQQKPEMDVIFVHGLLGGVFYTWRQKDRECGDLGLYGKNAFYTNESDDVFLVGEFKRGSFPIDPEVRCAQNDLNQKDSSIVKHHKFDTSSSDDNKYLIDEATNDLIQTLNTAPELADEWEVVFPDCPLGADKTADGPFSVDGNQWINHDQNGEYTFCWPMDWLPYDYPNIRVIGLNYETALSKWAAKHRSECPCERGKGTINYRSTEFLNNLAKAGVGRDRPVLWVGHSMGGLITKGVIVQALESSDPNVRCIGENTRGIIFLGTPHKGSPFAKFSQHTELIFSPTIEVKELEENSKPLLELHDKFLTYLNKYHNKLQIVSITEGVPTSLTSFKVPLVLVTEETAKIPYGDFYVMNCNHLGLSKPVFRQSFLYQRVLRTIDDVMVRSNGREDVVLKSKAPQTDLKKSNLSIGSTNTVAAVANELRKFVKVSLGL